MKVNGPGKSTLGQTRNFRQWAKHTWLYSDRLQELKGGSICQLWILIREDLNFLRPQNLSAGLELAACCSSSNAHAVKTAAAQS